MKRYQNNNTMPQETTTAGALTDGKVAPKEDTTIYATGVKTSKMDSSFHKKGEKIVCHRVLADRLVKEGKATREAPTETPVKDGGKQVEL